MSKKVRDVYLVTADLGWKKQLEDLLSDTEGIRLRFFASGAELQQAELEAGVALVDEGLPDVNGYVICRHLRIQAPHRIIMLARSPLALCAPIGRFCGSGVTLEMPIEKEEVLKLLGDQAPKLPVDELLRRGEENGEDEIREGVLRDLEQVTTGGLLDSITDPETKLFNYPFLIFKLDEEYKRATRFKFPLSCVMFGFEGEASEQVLLELAGIFLNESRDTDILGRFDLNSFLFLLPNTGPDGARAMAERILDSCSDRGLKDLAGDLLQISVGISYFPHAAITRREHLYESSRMAFLAIRDAGGGVSLAD